jgi:uncharacterized protein (DUF2249 family)
MNNKNKNSTSASLIITPDSKIGEILNTYPELEEVLIKLVPSFGKLKNPILRKTIGRIATIRQASEVGKISLGTLINRLREVAGQESWSESGKKQESSSSTKPDWVKTTIVSKSIDARPILDRGEHPVQLVMTELSKLRESQMLELITPFLPSPLIDMARSKGFKSWTREESPEIFKTFFSR